MGQPRGMPDAILTSMVRRRLRSNGSLLWVLLPLFIAMLAFQNCGQVARQKSEPDLLKDGTGEIAIADASTYYKIIYDPALEMLAPGPSDNTRLELNLKTGQAIAGRAGSQVTCAIPAATLQQLNTLFADAKVCQAVLPPGTAVCMAYPMADIELSNDTSKQLLRPQMCAAEIFLCEGRDATLREIIRQLTGCGS